MKITRLVILFNKDKIILGIAVSVVAFVLSFLVPPVMSKWLVVIGILILVNIALSLFASYQLYDQSNLYQPEKLFSDLEFKDDDKGILLHASFDPVSKKLENLIQPQNLKVYNLYGNRHEEEQSIKISNQVFPPHPKQVNVDPTNLKDASDSIDYIFAITSAHEILTQDKRVQFFKEAKRIMKNDGTLILCEQMRNLVNFIFFSLGAFHFVTFKDWERAINESGLKITRKEKLTTWGTIMYIKK
jgi:hypothetical protein